MTKYENTQYTNPLGLFGLLFSSVVIFLVCISLLNIIPLNGVINVIISLSITITYYLIVKKTVVKSADFILTSKNIKWNNHIVEFDMIKSYKIHWFKGAGIKIKLMDGSVKWLSSNSFFCDTQKFVSVLEKLDSILVNYKKGSISRKKSVFETKVGYYYAFVLTLLVVSVIIYKLIIGEDLFNSNLSLMLVTLLVTWSGVRLIKK